LAALSLAASLSACRRGGFLDAGVSCPIGDPTRPVEMSIVHRNADGTLAMTEDNGTIPLIQPPQGGRVLFVGARAKNLDGCPVVIHVALIDDCSGLAVVDDRPVILEQGADGWGEPKQPSELSNYANVPVCPDPNAPRDHNDEVHTLKVTITDRYGKTASRTIHVTPVCGEPDKLAECKCECSANFRLGTPCGTTRDGGTFMCVDAAAGPADGG
jgi:hypothetical protein